MTVTVTKPVVTGGRLQMNVYDASGAQDAGAQVFQTDPVEGDFTATAEEAGTTDVIFSSWDSGATGSFTVTYAKDVTGTLTSGRPVHGKIAVAGQATDYTFRVGAGQHVTVAVTKPVVTGGRLQMNVYDASGAQDASTQVFQTDPVESDFTATADEAGIAHVQIYQWDRGATGTFTVTYAKDVTGTLTSGRPVHGKIAVAGQAADYKFKAVAGRHVTVAVTKPVVTGGRLQMNVYDTSGAQDTSTQVFQTLPVQSDFTVTAEEAGTTLVQIYQWDRGATGSFTLTYTQK